MKKSQERRKRRRDEVSDGEESSSDDAETRRPTKPKRNCLLNPLIYDQWSVRDHDEHRIIYESPQNVGVTVYSDINKRTLVSWKRPPEVAEDREGKSTAKATMCVLLDADVPEPFAGRIEGSAGLPTNLPEDVRSSIAVLIRDVIHTCGVDPSQFKPQPTVREIVSDNATHYVYTIEYRLPTLTLPLPLQTFSPLTPCKHASSMLLSTMHAGEMTFTFCVETAPPTKE